MSFPRLKTALWGAMTLLCVVFAPTAAEFYWVNSSHATATYARLLALVVSDDYAYGPASGFAIMTPYWRHMPQLNQLVLGAHAVLASIVLLIGPFQLSAAARRRWPRLHRRLGRAYAGLGLVSMSLAVVYLLLTPMSRIYGGAPFAIGLWGIAILTIYTLVAGTWHIARGEVQQHRAVMVLNFAAMLIAPMLRLWWMVLGWLFDGDPTVMQAQTHVAVLMFLGLQTMIGAIVVMHLTDLGVDRASAAITRLRRRARAALPTVCRAATWLGLVAGAVVVNQRLLRFCGGVDLLQGARGPTLAASEQLAFDTAPGLFALEAVALLWLYVAGPRALLRLFRHGAARRDEALAYLFAVLSVCGAWLAQSALIGRDGVAGWGSAVYWGALALAALLLAALLIGAAVRGAARPTRELALHLHALLLSPALLGLMQVLFLTAGMGFEDAFLSAAVSCTSLALSGSYYYTVYGERSAERLQFHRGPALASGRRRAPLKARAGAPHRSGL